MCDILFRLSYVISIDHMYKGVNWRAHHVYEKSRGGHDRINAVQNGTNTIICSHLVTAISQPIILPRLFQWKPANNIMQRYVCHDQTT
jgi:hypothetical protein